MLPCNLQQPRLHTILIALLILCLYQQLLPNLITLSEKDLVLFFNSILVIYRALDIVKLNFEDVEYRISNVYFYHIIRLHEILKTFDIRYFYIQHYAAVFPPSISNSFTCISVMYFLLPSLSM